MDHIDRFLFAADFSPEQTWLLLRWCAQHGADEFTIDRLGLQGHPIPYIDRFNSDMASFRLELQRHVRDIVGIDARGTRPLVGSLALVRSQHRRSGGVLSRRSVHVSDERLEARMS